MRNARTLRGLKLMRTGGGNNSGKTASSYLGLQLSLLILFLVDWSPAHSSHVPIRIQDELETRYLWRLGCWDHPSPVTTILADFPTGTVLAWFLFISQSTCPSCGYQGFNHGGTCLPINSQIDPAHRTRTLQSLLQLS